MAQAQDMIRKKEDLAQLRRLLLDGVSSSPTATVDAAYFDSLRERVRSRKAEREELAG